MAWAPIQGSNNLWEYDNAATLADPECYTDTNGVTIAGIRTHAALGGNTQVTYIKCRKIGETIVRGELSKNYYDQQFANGVP